MASKMVNIQQIIQIRRFTVMTFWDQIQKSTIQATDRNDGMIMMDFNKIN